MLNDLIDIHGLVTAAAPRAYSRDGVLPIDWTATAIGITGGRGVGKTTLLLQKYWELFGSADRCLYLSADNVEVTALGLYKLGREHFKRGGEALIIDEAHRGPDWSAQVKSLIDSNPGKTIWLSGSSRAALVKGGADLSRRVVWYDLPGLSFREYLLLMGRNDVGLITLEDLLHRHVEIARDLAARGPFLNAFRNYLKHGHYPFFQQGVTSFHLRLQGVIDKVVSEDLPSLFGVSVAKISVLKKILWVIASSEPFQLNIEGLSRDLGISKSTTYQLLECLERGNLTQAVPPAGSGLRSVRKPEKLYLENTNLIAAITAPRSVEPSVGSVRETFFCTAMRPQHSVASMKQPDFIVDDSWAIEVGGASKGQSQLRDAGELKKYARFLAIDGIEVGTGNRIPLHLFGLIR